MKSKVKFDNCSKFLKLLRPKINANLDSIKVLLAYNSIFEASNSCFHAKFKNGIFMTSNLNNKLAIDSVVLENMFARSDFAL